MRFYLDQMLRVELAEALRERGHDVLRATEAGHARADDAAILECATRERRILITLDEHFGDWVVLPLSEHPGVIRVKVHPPIIGAILPLLLRFLIRVEEDRLHNHLVILSKGRERWIRTHPG